MEGKVSSKYQLTIPSAARKALGIKAGDTVRYEVVGGKLNVSVVRPNIGEVLDQVLNHHDFSALQHEVGDDAASYVREQRGWREWDDER